jgi:hypothetical protein
LLGSRLRTPMRQRRTAGWYPATEQKYSVLLEYAKTFFERMKQRLCHV